MILKIDKVVLAIGSIATLEILALSQGINGVSLSIAIAAISGLGGYTLRDIIVKRGNPPFIPDE